MGAVVGAAVTEKMKEYTLPEGKYSTAYIHQIINRKPVVLVWTFPGAPPTTDPPTVDTENPNWSPDFTFDGIS